MENDCLQKQSADSDTPPYNLALSNFECPAQYPIRNYLSIDQSIGNLNFLISCFDHQLNFSRLYFIYYRRQFDLYLFHGFLAASRDPFLTSWIFLINYNQL